MPICDEMIQKEILQELNRKGAENKFHAISNAIIAICKRKYSPDQVPDKKAVVKAIWNLIVRGLVILFFEEISTYGAHVLRIFLTDEGKIAAKEGLLNPEFLDDYLMWIKEMVPDASGIVIQYARESDSSYIAKCYLACAVMLGVASEAAFLEMAASFGNWLPGDQGQKFLSIVNGKQNYIVKFREFRKRIDSNKNDLPDELSDSMALTFDSVLDLLRIYRNESGHPTGKMISREDAFINLQMFARYLQRIYQFKAFFESNKLTST